MSFENPYFEEVAGGVSVGRNRDALNRRGFDTFHRRDDLVDKYAWAIPNEEAIATISEQAPILEVGAGRGYWAKCVREYLDDVGAVVATESDLRWDELWTLPLLEYDAVEAVREYGDGRALLLVWPPIDNTMAGDAVEAYHGDTVLYVGEGRGGCTADDHFHKLLHRQYDLVETVAIPTYHGIRDRLEVWRLHDAVRGGDRE